jgi:hypothetical protein
MLGQCISACGMRGVVGVPRDYLGIIISHNSILNILIASLKLFLNSFE